MKMLFSCNSVYILLFVLLINIPSTSQALQPFEIRELLEKSTVKIMAGRVIGNLTPDSETNNGIRMNIGTGFILSKEGIIGTNYHVIEIAHTIKNGTIKVQFQYDTKEKYADILYVDKKYDFALIKIRNSNNDYSPLKIGNSEKIKYFDELYFAGYPSTIIENSLYEIGGVFKAQITRFNGLQTDPENKIKYLDLSIPFSSGNSGGPIVDTDGCIVGVVTSSDGMNFNLALRINDLKDIISSMYTYSVTENTTEVPHPFNNPGNYTLDIIPKDTNMNFSGIAGDFVIISSEESEPNNQSHTANMLVSESTVHGHLDENDTTDWIRLGRQKFDDVLVSITHNNDCDFDFEVYTYQLDSAQELKIGTATGQLKSIHCHLPIPYLSFIKIWRAKGKGDYTLHFFNKQHHQLPTKH